MAAVKIGRDAGLKFVYAGNLPGDVGSTEDHAVRPAMRP
jgi:hypothetical protein